MKESILEKLNTIAAENQLNILFACESGSRGWQFPSPDSDYDVRFIYTKPAQSYLTIEVQQDYLNFPISGDLDIYGWDLRKVLQLMRKSNTTPFEWLQSPIVYSAKPGFKESLWSLCGAFFCKRTHAHHYLGIAKGAWETMDRDGAITIKKLFYVLRPLLSAKWCLEKEEIAPMTIGPLMQLLPGGVSEIVADLIVLKENAPEGFLIIPDRVLLNYITTEFSITGKNAEGLVKKNFAPDLLNSFFAKTIAT